VHKNGIIFVVNPKNRPALGGRRPQTPSPPKAGWLRPPVPVQVK